jgi:hypothetical protein
MVPAQLTTNQLLVLHQIVGLLLDLSGLILPKNLKKISQGELEDRILTGKKQLDDIRNNYSRGFLKSLGYTMAVKKYDRAINLYVRQCRICGATRHTPPVGLRFWPEDDLCSVCVAKDDNIQYTPFGVVYCS